MSNEKQHVSTTELAKQYGVSRETVARMLRAGEIPGVKFGHEWRVNPHDVAIALSQSSTNTTKRN